ncbi:hypothetical protein L1987_83342 [Smallanthus sonchifolius]|uniref:Uncharacterized protein n=1 Tax=Smallanthus sonchifolius TaxID=185202 RepID=A0ACB8YCK5_9ASTR|nr:hypothetical protein L1987_83342 [Smallanthus sonchifolius]
MMYSGPLMPGYELIPGYEVFCSANARLIFSFPDDETFLSAKAVRSRLRYFGPPMPDHSSAKVFTSAKARSSSPLLPGMVSRMRTINRQTPLLYGDCLSRPAVGFRGRAISAGLFSLAHHHYLRRVFSWRHFQRTVFPVAPSLEDYLLQRHILVGSNSTTPHLNCLSIKLIRESRNHRS